MISEKPISQRRRDGYPDPTAQVREGGGKVTDDRDAAQLAWSRQVAGLVVDALITAGLMPRETLDQAIEIATEEIYVRLALNDRPPT